MFSQDNMKLLVAITKRLSIIWGRWSRKIKPDEADVTEENINRHVLEVQGRENSGCVLVEGTNRI